MSNSSKKNDKNIETCPVCNLEKQSVSTIFCTNCGWEFIYVLGDIPEHDTYMAEKLALAKSVFLDHSKAKIAEKSLLEKIAKEQEKSKKQKETISRLELEHATLRKENDELQSENKSLTQKIEDLETTNLDKKIRPISGNSKNPVVISYSVVNRSTLHISFDKDGYGVPDIMYFCVAEENGNRKDLSINNCDFCIMIRGSKLETNHEGSMYFTFPKFLAEINESLSGFLYLPIEAGFRINPNSKKIKL